MKKIISTFVAGVMCFSAVVPTFAQKERLTSSKLFVAKRTVFTENRAYSEGKGVWLEWQTGNEKGYLGFRVYRLTGNGLELVRPNMLPGKALSAESDISSGKTYNYFDPQGELGSVYVIEAIGDNGRVLRTRQFSAEYIQNLEKVAGQTSEALLKFTSAESKTESKVESLELPEDLQSEMQKKVEDSAAPIDTQRWVAAQPGVKIGVKQDGLYRVGKTELLSAGIDIANNPANLQIYTDGIEQPLNIASNGDYIEFFGKGVESAETDTRIYYLVRGETAGKRFGLTVLRTINNKVLGKSFRQNNKFRDNFLYINNFLNGDRSNFMGALILNSGGGTNFDLSNVDFNAPTAKIEVSIQGFTLNSHNVRLVLNNNELGSITGANRDLMTKTFEIPTSYLKEGRNTLNGFSAVSGDTNFFEDIKVSYNRLYTAKNNSLSFYTTIYRAAKLEGFSSSAIRVFDLTSADSVSKVQNVSIVPNGSNFDVVIPSGRPRVLFAVADSAVLSPASLVANQPSNLTDGTNPPSMIIISHKDWMTEANNWKNYRQADGLTVRIVNVEDIFDEFGYGMSTADSIRQYLNYAYTNWSIAPKYIYLIGDASFDPKNHSGFGNANFVPTKLVDTTYMETGSDEALADFDNDGLAEIAVGRLPIRSAQEVTAGLAKVTAFEQGLAQAFSRGALFTSDLPDGYDFQAMSNRLTSHLPTTMPVTNVNRATTDAKTQIMNGINSGKYIISYTGHGTVAGWAGNMLHRNDVASMTNNNANLLIANMLTCLNGYYIEPNSDGLTEAMVKKTEGAAVLGWASSALTTPDIQEAMATRFYQQLSSTTMRRMGDLVIDAKASIGGGRDVRLSWVLLGDPATKVK